MCDIVAGQLILCFPRKDPAGKRVIEQIKGDRIEHVRLMESLEDKVERMALRIHPEFDYDLHLVEVPEGQEHWKGEYLQFLVQAGTV